MTGRAGPLWASACAPRAATTRARWPTGSPGCSVAEGWVLKTFGGSEPGWPLGSVEGTWGRALRACLAVDARARLQSGEQIVGMLPKLGPLANLPKDAQVDEGAGDVRDVELVEELSK